MNWREKCAQSAKPASIGDVGHRAVGVLDQPIGVAHAQLPIERGRSHANVLAAQPLELSCGQAELGGHRGNRNRAREILLHQQQRAAHARLCHGLRKRRMRLRIAPRARPVEQQHLARLLRHGAPEMLLDQIGCQRRSPGAAGAGDARPVGEKQPIGDDLLVGKGFEEILVVIPADARAPSPHQSGATQNEAAGTDADQWHAGGAHLAQVARRGLVDLGSRVQDPADHHHVVERIGRQQRAGRLEHHAAARRHGFGAARHDRPLHVQRAAAVTLVGGEAQVIDEYSKCGESEVMRQDHADAQRRTRTALRGRIAT